MDVIILAAGLGSRLGSKTIEVPKAMVQVAGRELILRVKDFLSNPAVGTIHVVAGYKADVLQNFLRQQWPEVQVHLNPQFEKGSILTLEAALPHVSNDFLLMNVDHIYPRRMLNTILANRTNIMGMCDFDRTLITDDMKVKLDSNKRISKIHKQLSDFDCGYIGMTYVSKDRLNHYRTAAQQMKISKGETAPVEWILGLLAEQQQDVGICDVSGFGWLEVDNQEDLANAEKTLAAQPNYLA